MKYMGFSIRVRACICALSLALTAISCSSGGDSESATATWGVTVNKAATSLLVGATETLSATATSGTISWYSTDTGIATVTGTGLVTGIAVGQARIVARDSAGLSAFCLVTVSSTVVPVTGFSFSSSDVLVGYTVQFTANFTPSNPTNQNVTWTSSDTSVATVSVTGLVSGLKAGTTTISAETEDGGYKDAETITVSVEQLTSIDLSLVNVPAITSFPMGLAYTQGTYTFNNVHTVAGISAFAIEPTELRYGNWLSIYAYATSTLHYTFQSSGYPGGYLASSVYYGNTGTDANQPVTGIYWMDAALWCNAASVLNGYTPVYYSDSACTSVLTASTYGGEAGVWQKLTANGFRLPTEAEWEAAARFIDGSTWLDATYAAGDSASAGSSGTIGTYAWYSGNSSTRSQTVGAKTANALGLYDMCGNLSEWCWDTYADDTAVMGYTTADPVGPSTSGTTRVIRGGNYATGLVSSAGVYNLATGSRASNVYSKLRYFIGFRVVRTGNF